MSIFKKIVKGVGNVVGDVVKAVVVEPIASSVNSVFNEEKIDVKYSTKAGKAIGGVAEVSTDTLHGALKKVGNAVTAGYADKAADLIRSDNAKSSVVGISEFTGQKPVFTSGPLKTAGNVVQVVGSVAGDIAGSMAVTKTNKMLEGAGGSGSMVTAVAPAAKPSNMSFLTKALTGVQNVLKSPVGQAAGSMLSSVVSNIAKPKTSNTAAQAAQQVVLQQATTPNVVSPLAAPPMSPVTAAALGTNLTANDVAEAIKTGLGAKKSVPVWLWPVVGGVGFLILIVVLIFSLGKRR